MSSIVEKGWRVKMMLIKEFQKNSLTKKTAIISIIVSVITVGFACNFTYLSVIKSAAETSARQASETIKQLAEKIHDDIIYVCDISANVETNRDFIDIAAKNDGSFNLNDFSTLSELFNDTHVFNSKIIDSIIFIRDDGQVFYEYQHGVNTGVDFKELDWYKKTESNNGFAIWYPPYRNEMFNSFRNETVGFMKMVTDGEYHRNGVLVMNINISYFRNELERVDMGSGSKLFITDEQNNIIVSADNNIKECEELIARLKQDGEDVPYVIYNNAEKNRVIKRDIGNTKWQIFTVIPEDDLVGNTNIVSLWVLSAIFTGGVITLALMLFVLNKITIPLTKLTRVMRQTDGKTGRRIRFDGKELSRKDEIGYLSQSYNVMIDNIDELMETVRKKSEEESMAQLRALQQQINSHFLYNTLDTIYWKVVSGDKKESADMVKRLSTYFRLALNRGEDITTLEKELQHIENYVEIEKYRYKNKIECIIDVDTGIYDFKVPKLLIQPLVENAIVHGLFTVKENAVVSVVGKRKDGNVIFCVEDNGVGMDVKAVESYVMDNQKDEQLKNSFALRNIYTRIKLYYKEKGTMQFYINEKGGAGVRVILPESLENETDIV